MTSAMLQSPRRKRVSGTSGGTTIQAPGRVSGPGAHPPGEPPAAEPRSPEEPGEAIDAWAARLVAEVARDQPAQQVSVFVPDALAGGLRLVAQIWGAGEDTGEVVVGEWIVPFAGSVCGRVYRTGAAALCADVALDPDYRGFPGGHNRSSLTVPVGKLGAVVAVVNIEAPWVGAFSVRDHDHVSAAAAAAMESFPA
jgi:GAF domain